LQVVVAGFNVRGTVQVKLAGVASVFPPETARTWNVCEPVGSPE
jgi:hypothetical protein